MNVWRKMNGRHSYSFRHKYVLLFIINSRLIYYWYIVFILVVNVDYFNISVEVMRPMIIKSPITYNSARYLYPPHFFRPYSPQRWLPPPHLRSGCIGTPHIHFLFILLTFSIISIISWFFCISIFRLCFAVIASNVHIDLISVVTNWKKNSYVKQKLL